MGGMDMDYSREVQHPQADRLIVRGDRPFNAEPTAAQLVEFDYTPEELIYCRNHSPVMEFDENTYTIKVNGLVSRSFELNIKDLRDEFEQVEVVAALQCAGNRRKEMAQIKEVKGILWDSGVIANCRWRGIRLRDVLLRAGLAEELQGSHYEGYHVWFASHVSVCQDDSYYGGSVPLEKALDPEGDVLLALEMNGDLLSPDHGYPLRVVVPGYTGARWVKWVDQITIATAESPNFYQQRDYKVLPPTVESKDQALKYWDKIPSITSLAVNSVVASMTLIPSPSNVSDQTEYVRVKGYTMGRGGKGGRIASIEIAIDDNGEEQWETAQITYQEGKWSWTLWQCELDVTEAKREAERQGKREIVILARAKDQNGELQKRECAWNLRGVAFNAYARGVWRW